MNTLSNVTNPSNAANVSKSNLLSEETEQKVLNAISELHAIFATEGGKLPSFNECGLREYDRLCGMALKSLTKLSEDRNSRMVHKVQADVSAVVQAQLETRRSAKVQYDLIPADVRAALPAFPDTVEISFREFSSVFPNCSVQQIAERMAAFPYKTNAPARGPKSGNPTGIIVSLNDGV